MIAALLLLAAPLALLIAQGVRQRPAWLAVVAPAALIAFVGARHWVSYAFVAGRLLFLVPFSLLLVVLGGRTMPRLRAGVGVALLLLSLAGSARLLRSGGISQQGLRHSRPADRPHDPRCLGRGRRRADHRPQQL